MSPQAEVVGAVVRAYLEEIRSMGALDAVRGQLSPGAAKLADKPPLPVSWIEVRLAHEPLVVLRQQRGRDEVRAFARRVATGQIGTMIRPLLSSTLRFFGGTPASLFSRLDTMTSIMLRGVKFEWVATAPSAGTVGIEYPYPVDPALFATWEGMLHVAYDLAKVPGTVGEARVHAGGHRGDIDVAWSAEAS
jgi:hypothetical protein